MVYISEAHARDEWPVGDPIIIDQPKTLSKRLEIANGFRDFFDFPNDFNIVVHGWPRGRIGGLHTKMEDGDDHRGWTDSVQYRVLRAVIDCHPPCNWRRSHNSCCSVLWPMYVF